MSRIFDAVRTRLLYANSRPPLTDGSYIQYCDIWGKNSWSKTEINIVLYAARDDYSPHTNSVTENCDSTIRALGLSLHLSLHTSVAAVETPDVFPCLISRQEHIWGTSAVPPLKGSANAPTSSSSGIPLSPLNFSSTSTHGFS